MQQRGRRGGRPHGALSGPRSRLEPSGPRRAAWSARHGRALALRPGLVTPRGLGWVVRALCRGVRSSLQSCRRAALCRVSRGLPGGDDDDKVPTLKRAQDKIISRWSWSDCFFKIFLFPS